MMTPFRKLIRQAVASAGGSDAIAEALRVDLSTVWDWYDGRRVPSVDTQSTVVALLTDPHHRTPTQNARIHALHLESVEAELEELAKTPGAAGDAYAHALAMLRGEVEA